MASSRQTKHDKQKMLELATLIPFLKWGSFKTRIETKFSLFVIRDNTKHTRISELENLDKLDGELQIKNIRYVKDPSDIDKVRLKKKIGIQKLSLDWYSRLEVQPAWYSSSFELHLLDSLEPPSKIEKLRIRGYRGSQLPYCMAKKSDSCGLADDTHIVMQRNPSEFSHLTELVLDNLPNIVMQRNPSELPRWFIQDASSIHVIIMQLMLMVTSLHLPPIFRM
jgi:hypothetical protein